MGVDYRGKPYFEGFLKDILHVTTGVDADEVVDKVRDAYGDDAYGTAMAKAKAATDTTLGKVGDRVEEYDKYLKTHRVDNRSLVARARNSVLQFPVYCSQSIRINEAHIIGKLFEHVYASLVQSALAQNPILTEQEAKNLVFLKKFHTNIKESANHLVNPFYEPIDDIDAIMKESVFFTQEISPNCTVEFSWVPTPDTYLVAENARLCNEPLTGLSYLKEANGDRETVKEKREQLRVLSDSDLRGMAIDRAKLSEDERRYLDMSISDIKNEVEQEARGYSGTSFDSDAAAHGRINIKRDAERRVNKALEDLKNDIKAEKIPRYRFDGARYVRQDGESKTIDRPKDRSKPDPVNAAVAAPALLKDVEIKKFNGLLPYQIGATFRIKPDGGGIPFEVHYIIGVKTILHVIRPIDLQEDLAELVTGKIKSLQKVRYKTGEIGFMDYMFNLKSLKTTAAKGVNYNKRWLSTLKRLGEYSRANNTMLKKPNELLTGGHIPIPNGTIILSSADVTNLTNSTGIDLNEPRNVKRLAKNLFLIAAVIVDSSAGNMKVMFTDSDSDWDVQSLASIDAEVAKTNNSKIMSELNRAINK